MSQKEKTPCESAVQPVKMKITMKVYDKSHDLFVVANSYNCLLPNVRWKIKVTCVWL